LPENRAVYQIMRKIVVEPERPRITRRMCIACCITSLQTDTHTHTHTHSEYVLNVAFPLQQWFSERGCVILSCDLSGCTIFFYILPQTARFKKNWIQHVFSYSLQVSSETFLIL